MRVMLRYHRFCWRQSTPTSLVQRSAVALVVIALFGAPAGAQWSSDGPNRAASSLPPRMTFPTLRGMLAAEGITLDCHAVVACHQAYAQQFNQIVEECIPDAALVATTLTSSLPLNLSQQEFADQRARWLRRVDAAARLEEQLLNQLHGAPGIPDEFLAKLEVVRKRRSVDRQIEVIQRRYLLTGGQVPPSSTAGLWSDCVWDAMDAEERQRLMYALDRHQTARLNAWLQAAVAVEQAVKTTADQQRGLGADRAGQQLPSTSLDEKARKLIVAAELAAMKDALASVKPQTGLMLRRKSWLSMQDVQPSAELDRALPRISFDTHPTVRSFAAMLLGAPGIELATKRLALPVLAEWIRADAEIVDERLRASIEVKDNSQETPVTNSRADLAKSNLLRLQELTGVEWLKEGVECPLRREELVPLTGEFAQALGVEVSANGVTADSKLPRLEFTRFIESEGMVPTPVSSRELAEVLDWLALNAEQLLVARRVLTDAESEWKTNIAPRVLKLRSVYSQTESNTESLLRARVECQPLRRELWDLVATHRERLSAALRHALGPTAPEGLALLDAVLLAQSRDAYTYGCLAIRSEVVSSELPNVVRWSFQLRALPAEKMMLTQAIAGHSEEFTTRERTNLMAALALQEMEEASLANQRQELASPDTSGSHRAPGQVAEQAKLRGQVLDGIRSMNRDVFGMCSERLPDLLLARWQTAAEVYGCSPRLVGLCEAQQNSLEKFLRKQSDAGEREYSAYESNFAPCEAWALRVARTVDRVREGRSDPALRVALKELLLFAPLSDAMAQADFAMGCPAHDGDSKR